MADRPADARGNPSSDQPPRENPLEQACKRHLEFLRRNCPHLLPGSPLEPGTVAEPVPVDPRRARALVATAAMQAAAAGTGARTLDDLPRAVVWTSGTDSLLVLLDRIRVTTDDGLVTVTVEVACDELLPLTDRPTAQVDVPLVVGTSSRPTGMLAAAPAPVGPAVVVERWGDALVALAWQALLDAAAGLTAVLGRDSDGAGLVPTSWTATPNGLTVTPQARHPVDRRAATVVRR